MTYFRLKAPLAKAMSRFVSWRNCKEIEPPRSVAGASEAIAYASDERGWKGIVNLFVHEIDGWTVFNDLSCWARYTPVSDWLEFAAGGDLVFASADAGQEYGEVVVVEEGKAVKEIYCMQEEEARPADAEWDDAEEFMLDDPHVDSDTGLVWMLRFS